MNYIIRPAVAADEKRICELYVEMLQTVYHTRETEGYKTGELDKFWTGEKDRIFVAEDETVVGFLSVEVYHEDEDYIYLARASAQTSEVTIDGSFTTNDHGIEYFTGITVPIHAEFLYGNNLKNKLEREVLTLSSQTLTSTQKAQVHSNIDVPSNADAVHKTGDENIAGIKSFTSAAGVSILSNGSRYRQYEFKNASGN